MSDAPKPPTDDGATNDNPALSNVLERNIRTIMRLRLEAARRRGPGDRVADAITAFAGRMAFIYIHVVWFGSWIAINTGRLGIHPFDPFPYGLLTLIVSLEAAESARSHAQIIAEGAQVGIVIGGDVHGNVYLDANFPNLTQITSARIP